MSMQPANRQVRNQFNISGSVIGQVAIGNEGKTVFNSRTKNFEAGSSNVDYKISGGNFSQANIGGQATYNNKGAKISAGSGPGGSGGITMKQLAGYTGAEQAMLRILRSGISAEDLLKILKKGHSIQNMLKAFDNHKGSTAVMVNSMLRADSAPSDSDDSSSDSD